MRTRIALGAIGVIGILWGALNILRIHEKSNPVHLALWLAVAAGANDAVLVPVIGVIGIVLARVVPATARPFVQGGLLAAAMATLIAVPLIYREGTQPKSKSLERQNYEGNLAIIVGLIAVVTIVLIVLAYRRTGRSSVNDLPSTDHSPAT
jgi:hypothetical protein